MNLSGADQQALIKRIVHLLDGATQGMIAPALNQLVSEYGRDPFIILIGCLLSLRSRDVVTLAVARNLFLKAKTPAQIAALSLHDLEEILYSIGFFKKKAITIKQVSQQLIDQFGGKVPATAKELLSLEGVGPKTANAVLGIAFNIPALCVDTHVHQIANRLGWVATKTPEQTEQMLKKIVPERYWIDLNYLLVIWGQNICTPRFPRCSVCAISDWCPKIGVQQKR